MIIHVFRRPLWTYKSDAWYDIGLYPAFGIARLQCIPSCLIDMLLLVIIFYGLHNIMYYAIKPVPESRMKILKNIAIPLAFFKSVEILVTFTLYLATGTRFAYTMLIELCKPWLSLYISISLSLYAMVIISPIGWCIGEPRSVFFYPILQYTPSPAYNITNILT